jgi:predicted ester cyclase
MFSRIGKLFLVCLILIAFAGIEKAYTGMEENKEVVRRYYEEMWNQKKPELLDELLSPDVVLRQPAQDFAGIEAYKEVVAGGMAVIPDFNFGIEEMIAEADTVTVRLTLSGTFAPTGMEFEVPGMAFIHVVAGQYKEIWENFDDLGLQKQVGLLPPSESPKISLPDVVADGAIGTLEENKAVVRRYYEEMWNQRKPELLDELLSPDVVLRQPAQDFAGIEAYKEVVAGGMAVIPDFNFGIEEMIAEGNTVAVRLTLSGTFAPTEMEFAVSGMAFIHIVAGQYKEIWENFDDLGLQTQVGLLAGPEPEVPDKDYTNVFFISLEQGLNMISVPLEPVISYTARSLAEEIGSTMVIRYDPVLRKFVGFTPAALGDGFGVGGGEGYIVNVPEARTVTFTGAAWTSNPPVEAAPPAQTISTWAFVVSGSVLDGDLMSISDGDYTAVVKNLRTGEMFAESVGPSGYFTAAWADLNRIAVIGAGDRVEVAVLDSNGSIVSGPFVHEVTLDAIRDAVLNMHLNLGDIIPARSVLLQNYPNPFNPETWIPYHLSNANPVMVKIYSTSGQLIRTLDLGHKNAGVYASRSEAAYWDGKNEAGEEVASAVYFYSITAGSFSAMRKMVVKK